MLLSNERLHLSIASVTARACTRPAPAALAAEANVRQKSEESALATTQLFAELLIIGIGVAIWLAFLLAAVLGVRWTGSVPEIGVSQLSALLGVAYVLGILVDRAAYSLFRRLEQRSRAQVFADCPPTPSVDDKERYILVNSASLREQILYNRSRLRISRSWILNFALIGIFSGIWMVQQRAWVIVPISVSAFVLSFLTAVTARALSRDHCNNIRYSYEFLVSEKRGGGSG